MKIIGKCMIFLFIFVLVAGFCLLGAGFSAQAAEELNLLYDDRKKLTSLVDASGEVTISNEVVTSYKVGTTTADNHVLVYQDGVLYAVGTGTATLTVGDKSYNVTVSPAPISLFVITGSSSGSGQEGNGSQSVAVEAGQAYSSYHENSLDVTEVDGYGLGWGSENRVGGEEGLVREGWDSYGHIDAFAPGMGGTTGIGSGFAYRWNQLTGQKVWIINIAVGGSCIKEWLPGNKGHNTSYDMDYYNQTISKITYAQTILKNEVAAGHYILSKQGIVNFGGANFSWYTNWSNESIEQDYETLWNAYKQELSKIDIDGDGNPDGLDVMAFRPNVSDGVYSGDRPAIWYMSSSAEYSQYVTISQIADGWTTAAGLAQNFPAIDYTTQSKAVSVPVVVYPSDPGGTVDNALYDVDNTHLAQPGYNALGEDMGQEFAQWFFTYNQAPAVESFELHNRSGELIPDTVNITVGENYIMTPRTVPVTVCDLTYEVTGAAELTYPLAVKGISVGTATLTVKQGDRVLKTMIFNVSEAHSHCVCGDKDLNGHTCGEAEVYVPLTQYSFTNWRYTTDSGISANTGSALRSGNYYLTADYRHSGLFYIVPGAKVNLCLNGYKITTSNRSFSINGELNICDCDGSGGVHSNRTGTAPVFYTTSGGTLNVYGGTYTAVASTSREFAGCFGVSHDLGMQNCDLDGDGTVDNTTKIPAVANIYGGKFIGTDLNCTDGSPTVAGSGACVLVVTNNTLNIYGGEFVGARPVLPEDGGAGGGGIIGNYGYCNIFGGKFTGSRCSQGAIWTQTSNLHISGNIQFEDNDNADIFLHYCDHLYIDDALTNETPIRVAGSLDNDTEIHLSKAEDAQHLVGGHALTMGAPNADLVIKFARDNTYCECGGTLSDEVKALCGHVCTDQIWTAMSQANITSHFATTSTTPSQTSTARYYLKSKEVWLYLSGNVNLTNEIEVSDGYTLHIDLNGYSITHSAGSNALFRVFGKLTICDSYGGGRAVGVRTSNSEASCVYVLNYNTDAKVLYAPEFHFYSGTLTGFNVTSATDRTRVVAKQAGVVQIGNNSGNKLATFNMYGGTITGGKAGASGGGNVYLGHGFMTMYDGMIADGESTAYAGNLRVGGGNTFAMYGGTIANGTSGTYGGNIRVESSCTFTMNDGVVVNGTAGSYGGNIVISSGTNRILGGTFENGLAATNGGNVYLGSGTLELREATLLGGCATNGGNMYINTGTANIYDTVMKNGKAGYTFTRKADGTLSYSTTDAPSGNGGNLNVNNATANLKDCTLEDGLACGKNSTNGFGGHIYNRYTLTMDGCTVSGGSGFRGSAVGIRDSSSSGVNYTELKNCTFFDNSASVCGSSVGAWVDTNGANILIEGCTFDDTKVHSQNGVLGFGASPEMTNAVNVTVKDCTVKNENQNDKPAYGIYAVYGTVALEGDITFDTTDANIYLTSKGQISADNFAPKTPSTVDASFIGKIGTSATDKSGCFTAATRGVTWEEGMLYINGLLQGEKGSYKTFNEALAAGETRLQLLSDFEGNAEVSDVLYLDMNGMTLTGDITGTGTLYGMDSATDDYTTDDMGRIEGAVSCTVAAHVKDETTLKRYMAIEDETGYTFHRFWLGVTHINLKPGATGVGYKAAFYGDEQVQAQVIGYGYILQLGEDGKKLSAGKEGTFVHGEVVTARLQNFDVENYGETAVIGRVYLTLTDGTTIESTACSYTLRNLVEQVATNASAYTETQLSALRDMLNRFEETTSKWNIEGLK